MPEIHKLFCGLSWFTAGTVTPIAGGDGQTRHQCIVLDSSPDGDVHSEHECTCGEKLAR